MADEGLKRTPLYDLHLKLNARMVPFAGWEMPLFYKGILDEVMAVREVAGIFDVSHMGEILVEGDDAEGFLESVFSNTVSTLKPLKARYGFFLNERGGFIDDLIIYRISEKRFLLCVNAVNTDKDYRWLLKMKKGKLSVENASELYSLLSIQGPRAEEIIKSVTGVRETGEIFFYSFLIIEDGRYPCLLSRTGYTGEDGFEIFYPKKDVDRIWKGVLECGAIPCGLGARDTLRIEACYPLYGHELTEENTPLEADLMRFVDLKKDFVGREALLQRKRSERFVAFVLSSRNIPREGDFIFSDGARIGRVTSGTFSPGLKRGIGMGYVEDGFNGNKIFLNIRGNMVEGEIISPPFIPHRVKRGGKK